MTVDNAGWSLLDRGGRLETLDRDECRSLLGSTNVGRLGYCTDLGPRIVPMNYTLVSESVTFRTGIDTEASHQLFDHPIAFQVDQVEPGRCSFRAVTGGLFRSTAGARGGLQISLWYRFARFSFPCV
jgi:Pyridoxamine 5'-phosphate oxidase